MYLIPAFPEQFYAELSMAALNKLKPVEFKLVKDKSDPMFNKQIPFIRVKPICPAQFGLYLCTITIHSDEAGKYWLNFLSNTDSKHFNL